jgi:hypothetical protein
LFVVELPRSSGEHRAGARLIVPPRVLLTLAVPPALRADAWVSVWFSSSFLAGEAMDAGIRLAAQGIGSGAYHLFGVSFLVRPRGRFFVPTCLCASQRSQGASNDGRRPPPKAARSVVDGPETAGCNGQYRERNITAAHPVNVPS